MSGRAQSYESSEPGLPTEVEDHAEHSNAHDSDVAHNGDGVPFADGEDATMPAGGDVVAKIRAHAARARSSAAGPAPADDSGSPVDVAPAGLEPASAAASGGATDSVSVPVWTPSATHAEPSVPPGGDNQPPAESDEPDVPLDVLAPGPRADVLDELVDVTVPFAGAARVGRTAPAPTGEVQRHSLIDGQTPPQATTSFWGPEDADGAKPFRASGMAERRRRGVGRRPLPLWVIVGAVAVAIVVASVVIALLAAGGAST